MEYGVHFSQHENCHLHLTYAKFNFKIYYPPQNERKFRIIKRQTLRISQKQQASFRGKDVLQIVNLFNKTIKNIKPYIPHETIICNDRDPPSINKNIKKLINDKNHAYKSYRQNENNSSTFQNFSTPSI